MRMVVFLFVFIALASCALDFGGEEREAVVPDLPAAWLSALGEPSWEFRWYGPDGKECVAETESNSTRLALPDAVSSPVQAFPFWPRLGIPAGLARPAGAVFPFGLQQGRIVLSWRGGVAASFYRELLRASGGGGRDPQDFDWPRFLDLLDSEEIDQQARLDPWTVDWRKVAIRTRAAGFDRRRIKCRPAVTLSLPLPCAGPWVRTSPFFPDVDSSGGSADAAASEEPDTLLSPSGLLRFDERACAWFPN